MGDGTGPSKITQCYSNTIQECNSDSNCQVEESCEIFDADGNNLCEETSTYEYQFCAPKISCNIENGEYLNVDSNNNLVCSQCPAGTYLNAQGICKNCEFGKFSSAGSTSCSSKTMCNQSENKYVNIADNSLVSNSSDKDTALQGMLSSQKFKELKNRLRL